MTTAVVYRPLARNEHGDPVDADGHIVRLSRDGTAKLGGIDVIIGGTSGATQTAQALPYMRGSVVSSDGMLGFPADSEIELRAGDLVEAGSRRWEVRGPVLWGGRPHSLSGRQMRFKWIAAAAN